VVGTREMCERIADTARRLVAESPPP
jgi:hypothetical protein